MYDDVRRNLPTGFRKRCIRKFRAIGSLPPNFDDLRNVDPGVLASEVRRLQLTLEQRSHLKHYQSYAILSEGLKQATSNVYVQNPTFWGTYRKAIFYGDLHQIHMFVEFWRDLFGHNRGTYSSPPSGHNLATIHKIITSQSMTRVRNAIAHFDVTFREPQVILDHDIVFNVEQVANLASLFMTLAILMTD